MASSKNLATPTRQDNPTFDRVWAELGFAQPTPRVIERDIVEDEPDEQDDTSWRDFLGYHSEGLR